MIATIPTPAPVRPQFGRVRVSMVGQVMMFRAEGPFDPELIAAMRRAVQTTLKRMPEMRRFVQLVEFGGSAAITPDGLAELRCFVEEQVGRGFLPYATILWAAPDLPGREDLQSVHTVMSPTRPVHIVASFDEAWAVANAALVAAGLPAQTPRRMGKPRA